VPVVPILVTGGRMLRQAGIPTYGVQVFFFHRDDIRFRGRDERVKTDAFYQRQEFLYDLVTTLSTSEK
jgi:hypothetical protein